MTEYRCDNYDEIMARGQVRSTVKAEAPEPQEEPEQAKAETKPARKTRAKVVKSTA